MLSEEREERVLPSGDQYQEVQGMDTEVLGARQGEQPEQMEKRRLRRVCGSSGSRERRSSPGVSTPNHLPGSPDTVVDGFPQGLSSRRAS